MSFCMSLGSPALATYSLMITILNQNWLRRICASLPKYEDGENQVQNPYTKRMSSARVLLEAAQQAPLQISETDGSLSSLVILEANNSWWNSVEKRLQATKRNVTLSLVAQMLVAAGAWVLTVAGSFIASLGDHTEALILSSSALWMWLVPIIWGWIAVGTQYGSDTIDDTLSEFMLLRAGQQNAPPHKTSRQEAFKVLKSLPNERLPRFLIFDICGDEIQQGPTFNYARVFTWWSAAKSIHNTFQAVATKYNDRQPLPAAGGSANNAVFENGAVSPGVGASTEPGVIGTTNLTNYPTGSSTAGAAISPGNSHSPVRGREVHTPASEAGLLRAQAAETRPGVVELQPIRTEPQQEPLTETMPEETESQTTRTWPPRNVDAENIVGASRVRSFRMRDLNGTVDQLNQYCGFGPETRLKRYPSWKEIVEDGDILIRIAVAAMVGLFVQWGTTIPAVIIAYLTDVKGIGCRSGSYLIYGIAGTAAFSLFLMTTLFSHAAILSHEAAHAAREARRAGEDMSSRTVSPPGKSCRQPQRQHAEETTRPCPYKGSPVLAVLAVSTRIFGHLIVIGNATWIILSSLWELVGFYDSCWCEGTTFSTGDYAWVALFKQAVDLRERAEGPWAGGVAMSMIVASVSLFGFVVLCKDVKER
ncbi:hypothetical protein N656DRAFT_301342 [Canariomyces notabilis]|uniref:Uncharacterized protein n=1 Tax=Canariomyces notabilis TaxID=2074819 RepID=A0AAN6TAC5_9PEZI|nr:hypothetical protein N656DRAFT_301342 [Canariomyces arenarius]